MLQLALQAFTRADAAVIPASREVRDAAEGAQAVYPPNVVVELSEDRDVCGDPAARDVKKKKKLEGTAIR